VCVCLSACVYALCNTRSISFNPNKCFDGNGCVVYTMFDIMNTRTYRRMHVHVCVYVCVRVRVCVCVRTHCVTHAASAVTPIRAEMAAGLCMYTFVYVLYIKSIMYVSYIYAYDMIYMCARTHTCTRACTHRHAHSFSSSPNTGNRSMHAYLNENVLHCEYMCISVRVCTPSFTHAASARIQHVL